MIRKKIRRWLLDNPQMNPFEIIKPGIFRMITTPFRTLPDFIIIGAGKAGTTSLYNYLIQHPDIYPPLRKEIKFFSRNQNGWYRSNFPTKCLKISKKLKGNSFVTCEASTEYLMSKNAPKRVLKCIPNVKLIIILRNPVDRTYSHFNDLVKYKNEKLAFDEKVKEDLNRLPDENSSWKNFDLENPNIIAASIYHEQVENWLKYFPRENFFITTNEELDSDSQKVLDEIFNFLNLSKIKISNKKRYHVGKYSKMNLDIRKNLLEFFLPYNEKLNKLLKRKFLWEQ